MSKLDNKTGNHYGRLTVIELAGTNKKQNALWLCKCSCGNKITVSSSQLVTGKTQSCGCLQKETRVKNAKSWVNEKSISKKIFNNTPPVNNTSGYKGISYHKKSKKWRARIMVNKKPISLGYYTNILDAVKARKDGELKYFGYKYQEDN